MPSFPQGAEDVLDAKGVERAAAVLEAGREFSVDVEMDSMHAFRARLCFVQLGSDEHIFLLDTLQPGMSLDALKPAFADATRTKFFHAAGGDLQFLAEAGVRVKGLFDTHRAATLLGWPKVGLADLVRERLGIELQKEHQQSDWSLRPLPEGMHAYLAEDVRYLTEIGRQVRQACVEADILEEVLLDCERLADEATVRPNIEDFEPKIARGGLSPKDVQVAVLIGKSLHVKRLQWAEAANVPMGRMLSNAALSAIATRRPKTVKELAKLEGVRGAIVREHGEEVLKLVADWDEKAASDELPAGEARGRPDGARKKREEQLKIFRAQKAAERKVTPSVVLPNAIIDALATQPPATVDGLRALPYFGEKRVRLYGEALLALLKA
jgi:ribonuclease D